MEAPCTCCLGTGEHGDGHECYVCDAGRTRAAQLESTKGEFCEGHHGTPDDGPGNARERYGPDFEHFAARADASDARRRRYEQARVVAEVQAEWARGLAPVEPDARWAEADPSAYPETGDVLSAPPDAQRDLFERTEAALVAAGLKPAPAPGAAAGVMRARADTLALRLAREARRRG